MPLKTTRALDKAFWLWSNDNRHNRYLGFHRRFDAARDGAKVRITLFADVHYKLYVNGQFVNAGPAPFLKPVIMADTYDLSPWIRKGKNDVFIVAHWVGVTVKYNRVERAGVIAAIKGGGVNLLTDEQWDLYSLDAWQADTPKKNWAIDYVEAIDLKHPSMDVLRLFAAEDYAHGDSLPKLAKVRKRAKKPHTYQRNDLIIRERVVPNLAWSEQAPLKIPHIYRTNTEVYLLADTIRYDNEHLEPATDQEQYHMLVEGDLRFKRRRGQKGYGFVFDYGCMTAGDYRFEIEVSADCTLDIQHVESLRDGRPYGTRVGSVYHSRFHLKKGRQRVRLHKFSGFRFLYLLMRDLEGEAIVHELTTCRCVADLPWCDTFEAGEEQIEAIYDISRRAIETNAQANAYDCNGREQGTYWGDGLWVVDSIGHMSGDFSHMRHLCYAMTDEYDAFQTINGALYGEASVPLFDYSLVPHDILERYYRYTGDKQAVLDNLHTCEAVLADFRAAKNEQGYILLEKLKENPAYKDGLLFLDHPGTSWHPAQTTAIDRSDPNVGINLFYLKALQCTAALQKVAGKRSQLGREIRELSEKLREEAYCSKRGLLRDSLAKGSEGYSQIVQCLGVMTGVLEGDEAARAMETVVNLERNRWVSQGTPYSYFFLCEALTLVGKVPLALEVIRRDYLPMLKRGATTTWEAFGGENHDSLNHAWSAPLPYLLKFGVSGLEPLEPGYGKLRLEPCFESFDQYEHSIGTTQGQIHLAWERLDASTVRFELSLPKGVEAELVLQGRKRRVRNRYKGDVRCLLPGA